MLYGLLENEVFDYNVGGIRIYIELLRNCDIVLILDYIRAYLSR